MNKAITVSQLVVYLKRKVEAEALLQSLLIEGEISNFRPRANGHWYFRLKDARCAVNCVMFASANRRVAFAPKEGDKVLLRASVTVYPEQGELELIVSGMRRAGLGDLLAQYEQLKNRLQAEGLFDPAHKKPLPTYPFAIGLVTGAGSAGEKDVLTTLAKRWPAARVEEVTALMQGKESAPDVIRALKQLDARGLDVIILARGGGSVEDLWSFNDETLARTIYAMQTPIITGVGHDIDYTIVDFVADHRSPTPTGAAVDAVPDVHEVQKQLVQDRQRLEKAVEVSLQKSRQNLQKLAASPVFLHPERLYMDQELHLQAVSERFRRVLNGRSGQLHQALADLKNRMELAARQGKEERRRQLENLEQEMEQAMRQRMQLEENALQKQTALLDAYSPLKVLGRGYSITTSGQRILKKADEVSPGDPLEIRLAQGKLKAEVTAVEQEEERNGSGDHV